MKRTSKPRRALATGVTVGLLVGAGAMKVHDSNVRHESLPACDVPAQPGDTVGTVAAEFAHDGSSVDLSEASIVAPDGHRREHGKDLETLDGSIMIQRNDTLRFSHIKPAVCVALGGQIEGLVSVEPVQATQANK